MDKHRMDDAREWLTALRRFAGKAGEAGRHALGTGGRLAEDAAAQANQIIGETQRKLGEDYYAIVAENPVIRGTLARSDLLVANRRLLLSAYNVPWTTTLLWTAAAGGTVALQEPLAHALGDLMHYGPGHVRFWSEVNQFMDTAVGSGHRLKFGHSIEYLPQIVERFGIEGVPAYFAHLLQDFTTVAGIPIVPNAWTIKDTLEAAGLSHKVALGLVSLSFSSMLAALSVTMLVSTLCRLGKAIKKKWKLRKFLDTAALATQNRDYNAAVYNYERALELERSPLVLMAIGQVYMERTATRFRAHKSFAEAVRLLSDDPKRTVPYGGAKLSVRGLAGLQALSTADVLADIHPEYWNDHVRDLVNATAFSFCSSATAQAQQSKNLVPEVLITPAQFSAAINYYLAAKAACLYPLAEERQQTVTRNLESALRSLGLVAQYDEGRLRKPATTIRELWSLEVLPPHEAELALA